MDGPRSPATGRDECEKFTLVAAEDVRYGVSMRRDFGIHLQDIAPETEHVKLIAHDGLVFDFRVIKNYYEPFLSVDGWDEFVDASNIQEGDSVVFVNRGNFCFKAHIFNSSDHEKSFFSSQRPTEMFGAVPSSTLCDHRVMNGHEAHKANDQPSMNLEEVEMSGQMFALVAAEDVRNGVSMRREFGIHLQNIAPETEHVKLIARDCLVFDFKVIKNYYEPFLSADGWEEFVDASNIHEGDSVVFVYRGNFCFKAHIFNSSGHEKSFFCCQRPTEIFGAVPSSTLCDHCVMNGHEAHEVNDQPSMNLEDCSAPLSNHVGGPSQENYILAQGATLPTEMKKRVEEKVQAIGSEIPIYVKKMTEISIFGSKGKGRGSRIYLMTFCHDFATAWLPYWKTNIDLEFEVEGETKSWPTKFNGVRLGKPSWIYSGWKEFVSENGLKVGDVCLFEVKKKYGQMLTVHLIRSETEV